MYFLVANTVWEEVDCATWPRWYSPFALGHTVSAPSQLQLMTACEGQAQSMCLLYFQRFQLPIQNLIHEPIVSVSLSFQTWLNLELRNIDTHPSSWNSAWISCHYIFLYFNYTNMRTAQTHAVGKLLNHSVNETALLYDHNCGQGYIKRRLSASRKKTESHWVHYKKTPGL
jgi:hypothetical protein